MNGAFGQDPDVLNALNDLEEQRKYIALKQKQGIGALATGILLFILCSYLGSIELGTVLGLAGIIPGIFFLSGASNKKENYQADFKHKVIAAALAKIDSSLTIRPELGIPPREFVSSQMFAYKPDRYRAEDLITGKSGKTNFYFSEVHAEYKTEVRTKNGTRTVWHEIFKGIIFCADFNKDFRGMTVVRPQDIGTRFGAWFSKNIFSVGSGKVVELESDAFQNLFVTYSTDQVEARYILTPALMDRICNLNNLCAYTVSLSFIDSRMYIAFPLDKDYFEPPVFSSLLKPGAMDADLNVLKFIYGIVDELDLNTRIWTKQ